jgi:hypothetical protein
VAERYATARELGCDLNRFIHQGSEPVGLSDLAEWMDHLFVGARARKLQLLEMASQVGSDLPTVIGPRYVHADKGQPANGSSHEDNARTRPGHRLRSPMATTTTLMAVAVMALLAVLAYTRLSTSSCGSGTYILEVVPPGEGDARRLLLRAVPRDETRTETTMNSSCSSN